MQLLDSFSKNQDDVEFRSFYAHENNILLDLDRLKFLCTERNWTELEDGLDNTDVSESCGRQGMITRWRFLKLTNSTLFSVLLKDVPLASMDAVVLKAQLKFCRINCVTLE